MGGAAVRHRPRAGRGRDHAAPVRGDQLADRGLPHRPARRPSGGAPRRHAAPQGLHGRGGRDRHQRPLPRRERHGRHGPVRRRDRVLPAGVGDPAVHVDDARPGRAARRAGPDAPDRSDPEPAPATQRPPASPDGRPGQHRQRHRERAAGAARDRWRAGLPRPLPPRVADDPSRGSGRRQAPVGARRAAGLPAGRVRGARGVAGCAVRRRRTDHGRGAGRFLRRIRVPDDPAADRYRVRQQADPGSGGRAADLSRADADPRPHRP